MYLLNGRFISIESGQGIDFLAKMIIFRFFRVAGKQSGFASCKPDLGYNHKKGARQPKRYRIHYTLVINGNIAENNVLLPRNSPFCESISMATGLLRCLQEGGRNSFSTVDCAKHN
ncbi:hypothetical protein CEXT_427931 [Caerostris extrusa]|uniref:Uncharacterized protein n=1 Tax=Caerostris extrusa TaxID=172846 RepID=A0AAV4Y316_CAEEX|nr:hypothetical protein CEXT_427931 [Caerostris extrusa]